MVLFGNNFQGFEFVVTLQGDLFENYQFYEFSVFKSRITLCSIYWYTNIIVFIRNPLLLFYKRHFLANKSNIYAQSFSSLLSR